jgi:hypothetical protein
LFLLTTPSPLPMYFSRNRGFFYSNHYSNRGVQQILPQSLCPLQNCLNMVTSTTQATSPGARILPRKPTNVVPTAGKNFTKGEHPPHTTGGASGPAIPGEVARTQIPRTATPEGQFIPPGRSLSATPPNILPTPEGGKITVVPKVLGPESSPYAAETDPRQAGGRPADPSSPPELSGSTTPLGTARTQASQAAPGGSRFFTLLKLAGVPLP